MPVKSKSRTIAKKLGRNRYRGKPCAVHPEARGARYTTSSECCKCAMTKVAAYRATPRGRANVLNNARQRKYGVTPEQFSALLARQHGCCAICGTTAPGGRDSTWHLDHNHHTKAVRGVLCHKCNVGLGCLGDNPDKLRAAIQYLELGTPAAEADA